MGLELGIISSLLTLAVITFVVVIMCMVLLIDLKLRNIINRFDKVLEYIESKAKESDKE